MSEESHVAYQNKDIAAKYLAEHFSDKSFATYGVKVPRIVQVLPTNLPVIEANELRLDNLFLLEDGSLALVDYESSYAESDKIKYLNYIIRTLKRSMTEDNIMRKIRMIVIYTADIAPGQTRPNLDIGCLQFQLEDEQEQVFILAGILVFADKVIDNEDSKEMRDWIMMTKVSRLFEEEKIEYGKKVAAEAAEKAAKEAAKENEMEIVKRMLSNGIPLEQVKAVATTLTEKEIKDLQKKIIR